MLPTTGYYWLLNPVNEFIVGLRLSAGELISAARTEPGVSETRTDALSGVKMFSVVLLSHKDKP